ncbi:Odorant-binding protein 56a [Culex quinquefasciatus]|uniref:Odorant-binding protein 56a n=1 Tax=Culex quinquefasciatus TaxID=7176 RepID=B0WP14_CULQU|nr:Odorant-binding protein 56a [Culex quinquefasciatus]|eukprot:XP_001850448.1 Odorant-binding protein 56a [Culex quinquefasciatus]
MERFTFVILVLFLKLLGPSDGALTKKGEISLSKTTAQIDAMLPNEMKAFAKEAMTACKDAQAGYKETCDKIYYSVKCVAEFNKDAFLFP